ncbi:FAD:protein FMN transferase [Noviherbaspirillum sp. UKPF54]|uniref:FAD:protein FMN transferase n=1 Tax=Noviherbaspirillum sp. UKPF54 TaxID=2601898 RepID=UPI001FEDFCA4|nr:FAD:protein FMN transferase [Noviherbaspirillum sp. UKPF54]
MMRRAQPWLGTLVDITIADSLGAAELAACFDDAFAAVAEVQRLMSFHDPQSDVSRINRALPDVAVPVHAHTHAVLRAALDVFEASAGIFDIACAPRLVEAGCLPAPGSDRVRYLPGGSALALDDGFLVTKSRPLWIDLGGIAKGYAVDLAIHALRSRGVRSACVNAGGDLRVLGDHPVSIRDPRSPGEMALQIDLRDAALATSANYFSGRTTDARSVLIDGRNGRACPGDFSVTVQALNCMLADALTKVVAATKDARHTALPRFGASAFII